VGNTDIKSYRILRLSHFINIYNSIKQHTEALKIFQPQLSDLSLEKKLDEIADTGSLAEATSSSKEDTSNSSACCSGMSSGKNPKNEMTESKMYDM
jgi:hypothetical protein